LVITTGTTKRKELEGYSRRISLLNQGIKPIKLKIGGLPIGQLNRIRQLLLGRENYFGEEEGVIKKV